MEQYTMHDLVHDLATMIMGDELIDPSKNHAHVQKYCRYALVTKYDRSVKLSNILPSKVRALHFSDSGKLDLARGAFSFAKHLRILDLSECSSILLPASLGKLKQLKYLVAPRMQNEGLPEYITDLSKLQYLNLNGSSHISALPESIGKLGCLEYLDLSGCSAISKLPESFGDLKWLMHLDMSHCSGIQELSESFGNLTNLKRLDLSKCSVIKTLPESLCGLTQLQYLNLSSCRYITRLPEEIGSLANLQYLNMKWCDVKELPESFKRLHNLLHLGLERSFVEKGLVGALHGLTALEYLDMSVYMTRLEITEREALPVAMTRLTNLKVLNLSSCLSKLFDTENNDSYLDFIGTLTNLEHLDLSMNYCTMYLPESIGNLKRLRTLVLEHNGSWLKCLPESIAQATGLKSVLVEGCSDELIDQANSLLGLLTLPLFKVRAGDDVSAQSNLHLLEGENPHELDIVSIENVRFLEEAQRIKLFAKQNLLRLKLVWTLTADRHLEDKDLLEQLLPPMSLESLYLQGYGSPIFPSWLMTIPHHLPNLTSIQLHHLPSCSNLPPLGQLQYLRMLYLNDLPNIKKIDRGICGGKGAFPRLAKLFIVSMRGLEEWNTTYTGEDGMEEFMFPMLDFLDIRYCPRLRLNPCPPKCRKWLIIDSDQVIPSLEEVQTISHRCNSTPTTTSLDISNNEHHSFRLFHHFPGLQELEFFECPNLTSLPEGIEQLSSLQSLELVNCDRISALPEWLSNISSLKKLVIRGCTSIVSLPACIQQLTNLQKLLVERNQELQQWCHSEENKATLAHIKHKIISDQTVFI
jgi:Leucine-rich repeat (LRR) protein